MHMYIHIYTHIHGQHKQHYLKGILENYSTNIWHMNKAFHNRAVKNTEECLGVKKKKG